MDDGIFEFIGYESEQWKDQKGEYISVGFCTFIGKKILDKFGTPPTKVEKETVICAAVKLKDGLIIRGHRHGDCINNLRNRKPEPDFKDHIQGFITSRNRFVTREEGRILQDQAGIPSAEKNGGYRGNTLFSEDLY